MLHESEIRFEDPVGEDIYEASIAYCNENNIDFDDFCRLALKALEEEQKINSRKRGKREMMEFNEFRAEVDRVASDTELRVAEMGTVLESVENILEPLIEHGGYDAVMVAELKRLLNFVRIVENLRASISENVELAESLVTLNGESS